MEAFLFLGLLLILASAASRWGVDSRPGINGRETFFAFDSHPTFRG
jgi:hypothetical protein